uniref:Pyr_redox_2 domain-containing protein n=1 Tax=Macrostomum lignano TaxID=282301 RepID=A0A1I8FL01_9PLAT
MHRFQRETRQLSAASLANPEPSAAGEAAEVRIGYGELLPVHRALRRQIRAGAGKADPDLACGIRDTETVADLSKKLSTCRRFLVVGNGGIATESRSNEVCATSTSWAVRTGLHRSRFFDAAGAASSCCPVWRAAWAEGREVDKPSERQQEQQQMRQHNGELLGVDLIVSATGVTPTALLPTAASVRRWMLRAPWPSTAAMRSSLAHVFAAVTLAAAPVGRPTVRLPRRRRRPAVVSDAPVVAGAPDRLFARPLHVGGQAGESPPPLDIGFELFTHVTRFFSYKIVLLACTTHKVGQRRIRGAASCDPRRRVRELDLSQFGEHLLDPGVDIDDYFD